MTLNGIQLEWLVVGAILMIAGAGIAMNRETLAAEVRRYYNSIPDPKWRPRWLPWQFRPTGRQAMVVAWLAVALCWSLGIAFIVTGLT